MITGSKCRHLNRAGRGLHTAPAYQNLLDSDLQHIQIAHLAEEAGMPLQLGPTLIIDYGERSSFFGESCMESKASMADWRMNQLAKEAALQIERTAIETQKRLSAEPLTLADAKALVQAIPTAAELMPELKFEDLQDESLMRFR
jgi:hypothetical protein